MKDRRTIAAILAAALTLTMCGVSAVADGEADSSAAPDISCCTSALTVSISSGVVSTMSSSCTCRISRDLSPSA